jgi:hypothetical protein
MMTQRKETIRNLLNFIIIIVVIILFGMLCGFFFGILDLGEKAGIIFRTAGLVLLILLGMRLVSEYNKKPLTKEMEEERIKEADPQDRKQLLFKPTTGYFIFILFLILLGIYGFFNTLLSKDGFNGDVSYWIISSLFMMGLGLYMWYTVPVFIFAEDSVQIKSYLFYLLGIDRVTVIRYTDITSVRPYIDMKSDGRWGTTPIVIFMNGITQGYNLSGYDEDEIVKIYLRFKEKLGDKVRLE